jgi:CAAX protease family protein
MEISWKSTSMQLAKTLRQIFTLTWRPNKATLIAFISYLLVVGGLILAFQVFTTTRVAANFLTFGPLTLAGLGVALPVFYTVLKRHRPLEDVGITKRHLAISLIAGFLLGLVTYLNTLGTLQISWSEAIVPIASMALTVGLFEAIFFRGWLQLRFEDAFGLIPGILLSAVCYALYHVGYGMGPGELIGLFGLGLVFGTVFRLTKNIFLLWPFFTPVGGLYVNIQDGLSMPLEATIGFVLTLIMMFSAIIVADRLGRPGYK